MISCTSFPCAAIDKLLSEKIVKSFSLFHGCNFSFQGILLSSSPGTAGQPEVLQQVRLSRRDLFYDLIDFSIASFFFVDVSGFLDMPVDTRHMPGINRRLAREVGGGLSFRLAKLK